MNAVTTAVFDALKAGTALITNLGGTAIYHGLAPDGKAMPYVVFNVQAGGPDNIYPGDLRSLVLWIRAYASSAAAAGSADALAEALLHRQALSVSGYSHLWCARENNLTTVEVLESGEKRYMSGGMYRIRIDA